MEPQENCTIPQPTPTPSSQSKRPSQTLYVPKQRLLGGKDKADTQTEVKPRPRPRYTDKARKNAKNKKDKAGAMENAAVEGGDGGDVREAQNCDSKCAVKEERLQDAELVLNGNPELTDEQADVTSTSLQEEQGEEESWDTLFNDDGDCLDPHLLEEVGAWSSSV